MYLNDPSSGKPSVSVTMFVLGVTISSLKLLTSGLVIGGLQLGVFSGVDFAAAVGAVGAIYAARKHSDNITGGGE